MAACLESILNTKLRELMVSQGSVVSELEFTELKPETQQQLGKQLQSLEFDVTQLEFGEQCDVVKFCFHRLGVCSWYELSAVLLHSFVAEAAAMHRRQDALHPVGQQGASSWGTTVQWCHLLYWILKVGGAARFLTYFDVFAMLVAVVQVGTHQSSCWVLGERGGNSGARLRMRLSTLLKKVNEYIEKRGGIFQSLTGSEISAMKRKLANCFPRHHCGASNSAGRQLLKLIPWTQRR